MSLLFDVMTLAFRIPCNVTGLDTRRPVTKPPKGVNLYVPNHQYIQARPSLRRYRG